MTWNLDLDDFFGGSCNAGLYPLHKAMNNALSGTVPTPSPTTAATNPPPPSSTTPPYTGAPTTATTVAGGAFCSNKPDGLHPDPESCASFYNCAHGLGGKVPCGQGTYYDPVIQACNWPEGLSDERRRECGL
jgi:hypothetical protein